MAEHIVYSHEVGMQKPDPRIYELTCEVLSVAPTRVLFVDDRAENVDTARAFGMRSVLVGPDDANARSRILHAFTSA